MRRMRWYAYNMNVLFYSMIDYLDGYVAQVTVKKIEQLAQLVLEHTVHNEQKL